ncbi:MAG: DUF4268 domain-containing protein [Bryobacterales bacterium]|nr:DUF4268 domain-containing protein [Bryobacterales bacterium]
MERSAAKSKLFANRPPGPGNWIGTGVGKAGQAGVAIGYDYARGELYIDAGKDGAEKIKLLFDALQKQRTEIEREFGETLGVAQAGRQTCFHRSEDAEARRPTQSGRMAGDPRCHD